MRVLISGAGIVGPTLAYWLNHYGFETTIVEKAPRLRTGGYVIDFWGAGFDVAERMNLMEEIKSKGYLVEEVRIVDRTGRRVAGFPAAAFARATGGRYVSLPRADLAALIFGRIADRVEPIFDDSISTIREESNCARVVFASGLQREFDLVVGADGLHSRVREIAFGPEAQFEQFLGYKAAAFEVAGYRPRDELVYVMYTEVGQQVGRFAMRDDRTMILLTFADRDPDVGGPSAQRALLRRRFGSSGWECPAILDALDSADGPEDLYFDRVSQIRMKAWSRGRVVLVGDAAYCVSLLAGQGSALGMAGAYILAGELHRAKGNYSLAFARYGALFGPLIDAKQKASLRFAGTFAPKSRTAMWLRNRIFNLLSIGWVADLAVGRDLADRILLPDY
ncbi:MAG TPA: FAD-binding domain [Bryobacteraceae bacterium]|nr:FAD-binding domain [Bryobacteraceae bacterium]